MAITREIVEYVAHLARIELDAKESEKLSGQLKGILDFIDRLKDVDIKHISPTSHILPINNVLRQDQPVTPISIDKILENAPEKRDSFFVVPKVIE